MKTNEAVEGTTNGPLETIASLEATIREQADQIKALQEQNERMAENAVDRVEEFAQLTAQISQLTASLEEMRKCFENSEEYRRAYQQGKYALYSMGEPFTTAAMEHLPCGEGALDRKFTKLIEMPRIAALQSELTQAQERVRVLGEILLQVSPYLSPAKQGMVNAALPTRSRLSEKYQKESTVGHVNVSEVMHPAASGMEATPSTESNTEPVSRHIYESTACVHEKHGDCRITCKFCESQCICVCHSQPNAEPEGKPK